MTNPITDTVPKAISAPKADTAAKIDERDVSVPTEKNSTVNARSIQSDSVELSSEAQSELDKAGFDQEKVDRIKQAIADGNYPVDPRRVAESFAEIEKLL